MTIDNFRNWFSGFWLLDWFRLFWLWFPVQVAILDDALQQSLDVTVSAASNFLTNTIKKVLEVDSSAGNSILFMAKMYYFETAKPEY